MGGEHGLGRPLPMSQAVSMSSACCSAFIPVTVRNTLIGSILGRERFISPHSCSPSLWGSQGRNFMQVVTSCLQLRAERNSVMMLTWTQPSLHSYLVQDALHRGWHCLHWAAVQDALLRGWCCLHGAESSLLINLRQSPTDRLT